MPILTIISCACFCALNYSLQVSNQKAAFKAQVQSRTTAFLQQTQGLLQGLRVQLAPEIKAQNWRQLTQILRTFEDQIFVLAKQDLILPLHVQWLSLNAPRLIINTQDIGHSKLLAQESYYLKKHCESFPIKYIRGLYIRCHAGASVDQFRPWC